MQFVFVLSTFHSRNFFFTAHNYDLFLQSSILLFLDNFFGGILSF